VKSTERFLEAPSHIVPPPLIVAVGRGLTVIAFGVWFVIQPAAFVSRTEIVPPTLANISVTEFAEGSPIIAAPPGIVQL
jgi:hypothetical protein